MILALRIAGVAAAALAATRNAPDVALEEGRAAVRSGDAVARSGRYHALYVRRDGRWLQSNVYDLPGESARSTPADHLKDLTDEERDAISAALPALEKLLEAPTR